MSTTDPTPDDTEHRQTIIDLRRELDALRDRVAELEDRVDDADTTDDTLVGDWRDRRVVDHLQAGEVVTSKRLKALYAKAGVRAESTVRDRLRDLTTTPVFEFIQPGKWRYQPDGGA